MIYNIHNFRVKVPAYILLLVVMVSTGIAALGDITQFGVSLLVSIVITKAIPAMLTVAAAVFYSPVSAGDPSPVDALAVEPKSTPDRPPLPISPVPTAQAPEAAA